MQIEEAILINQ